MTSRSMYSFLPITRPVQIVDPMGFHLKIKLATRPNCRPSVEMDLLSGFKDWFFWQNWIQIWLPALYFQF